MNSAKKGWGMTGVTLMLFALAFTIFPFSAYLGRGTKDPDYYEFLGWFASVFFLFLAIVLGTVTLRFWLNQKSQMSKIIEDYKFVF